ncbi:helix-turn-helix transcriptional regulator [Labrenzia sp. DG1229]|uniref:helix-turn-helix domain-containing protein n=1 Tax=Labrenzia sp. DG1229 TaxID=681847 RepID=UPI0006922532|nr:helix-turn-helix transcriptional regulator [Labrenzia sp. DG1229]
MTTVASYILPAEVQNAVASGTNIVRAYREHLGYSLEDFSATSGLAVHELNMIEAGHRFEKGYRSRTCLARSSPTVIISDITALLCGSIQTHLGTSMPSEAIT